MPSPVDRALAPLPDAYHDLFARFMAAAEADDRIRGVWLSGSVARGAADPGSDLDLVIAVADDAFDAFEAAWNDWLAKITPLVLIRSIPDTHLVSTALTEACCRIDVVLESKSRTPTSFARTRITVLDRDGLSEQVPAPADRPGPDPAKVTAIAEEFWRQQAIFPAMLTGRRDLLVCAVGLQGAHQLLYDLFVESNQPLPAMGVKHMNARLSPYQREVLASLPLVGPEPDELSIAMAAVRHAMNGPGRQALERCGGTWPGPLAGAVSAHVESVQPGSAGSA